VKLTVCNGKGGAGKTTLSVLLATAFAKAGHRVALLDCDPQATATRWLAQTGEVPIAKPGEDWPMLIIDTPPQLASPNLHAALAQSDAALLVSSPSPADLWTSQDTVAVIRQHLPEGRPARLIFNQVQARTVLAKDLATLAGHIGLPALSAHIGRRQAYQHAAILGWRALDKEGREELLQTALEIAALGSQRASSP
jgi:chromosome partitioning protein